MAEKQYQMPMSTAGLVRYFEESQEAIKIKPEHVAGACFTVIIIEILLRLV